MKLSPLTLAAAARKCARRMPVAVALLAVATVYSVLVIQFSIGQKWISMFLSTAIAYTTAVYIWFGNGKTHRKLLPALLVAACAIALADGLWAQYGGRWGVSIYIGHLAVWAAVAAAILFIPAAKQAPDEMKSWRFAMQQMASASLCAFIGLVTAGAIVSIYLTVKSLFLCDVGWNTVEILLNVLAVCMPVFVFMCRIPFGSSRTAQNVGAGSLIPKLALYLFLPLTCVSMLILYIYGAKILLAWSLPDGMVSMPVASLFGAVLLVEFLLYPTVCGRQAPQVSRIATWLPRLMLPLLVLMGVGLARRLHDYGITPWRLYGALFCLWAFAVCIGLWVRGLRRFVWIPVSFAGLFMATSVVPYANICDVCARTHTAHAKQMLTEVASGSIEFPTTQKHYQELMNRLPKDEQKRIASEMYHIDSTYGDDSLEQIIAPPHDCNEIYWQYLNNRREDNVIVETVEPLADGQ